MTIKGSEFPSVKAAKEASRKQLEYYNKMTSNEKTKPHIRIHYQQNDDINHCGRDCAGDAFGCDLQFNSEKGVPACMNGSEPHVLWYELISGDINDLKKEKE